MVCRTTYLISALSPSSVCSCGSIRYIEWSYFSVVIFASFSLEVGIWLPAGYSCCSYYAYESDGFLEVCAEILFINETGITTTNYTVTLYADSTFTSYSAQSMYTLILPKGKIAGSCMGFLSSL